MSCPVCKKETPRNRIYCSNACKQRAYRIRRNVTAFQKDLELLKKSPKEIEYNYIKSYIRKEILSLDMPTYDEYAFVRESHPEIQSVKMLSELIIQIKKKLYGYPESPYRLAFENYLKRKLNS
ncbi:hypothetical protein N9772_05375 [Bacteroidia bacterium]|nr:hypothetical protein [Bacteroidia bacterium]